MQQTKFHVLQRKKEQYLTKYRRPRPTQECRADDEDDLIKLRYLTAFVPENDFLKILLKPEIVRQQSNKTTGYSTVSDWIISLSGSAIYYGHLMEIL